MIDRRQIGDTYYGCPDYLRQNVLCFFTNAKRTPLNVKKMIGCRAALALVPNVKGNLGIGVPEYVATMAAEEGCSDQVVLTRESRMIGGVPCGGFIHISQNTKNVVYCGVFTAGGLKKLSATVCVRILAKQ